MRSALMWTNRLRLVQSLVPSHFDVLIHAFFFGLVFV